MAVSRKAFLLLFLSAGGTANAQNLIPESAQQLLSACQTYIAVKDRQRNATSSDVAESSACLNVVRGIAAGIVVTAASEPNKKLACIPGNVDFEQMARIVVRRLQERPEVLHLKGNVVAASFLLEAFPCNPSDGT